jgi:hypothetical protein
MKKYYCPISNEQFNQLINFGKVLITKCLVVEHNDDSDLVQANLVNTFIKYLQFKYDEEYLVLEVNSHINIDEKEFQINIHQVEGVFPISEECSKAVTFKHSKIAFSKPIFSVDSLQKINDSFFISDSLNGAECLISIFKNILELDNVEKSNLLHSALKFRKGYKLNSLNDECNIIDFTFLYAYQAYYPLTTLGYFFRTAEILTRKALVSRQKPYSHEILKTTDIYKLLIELNDSNPESNLQEIINFLLTDSRASKFIENLTSSEEIKYFIVIPMFLKIIDEFNEHNQNLEKTSLESLVNFYGTSYKKECQQLVQWVGAFLGYGNCYDYYYLKSNLIIFKNYRPIVIVQENQNLSKIKLENNVEEITIRAEKDTSETLADKQNIQTLIDEETKVVNYESETDKKKSESIKEETKENTTLDNEQTNEVIKKEENELNMGDVLESKTNEESSETSGIINDAFYVVEKDVQFAKSEVDVLIESIDEDQRIILALLNKKGKCSFTELIKELKIKQKNTFDEDAVKKILKNMNNVDLFMDKNKEKARIKPRIKSGDLFETINYCD